MTVSPLQNAKDSFKAFRAESIWLRSIFDVTYALFSSGAEVDSLLKRTAPLFFFDLNQILVEYWILVVSRITDPAQTGKRENLTVALLLTQLDRLELCTPEIKAAANGLKSYGDLLKNARNRAVSHADKETFLNPALLGDHQESQVTSFLESLQRFNDLVGIALDEGPLDFRSTYGAGDVFDLLRALRNST